MAEEVERLNQEARLGDDGTGSLDVDVAKVDCVASRNLCGAQRIRLPTPASSRCSAVWDRLQALYCCGVG